MKRLLSPLIAAALALGLATPASAGTAPPEPSVSFVAKIRGDEAVKVKKFRFIDVPVTCDQGVLIRDNLDRPLPSMGVDGEGRFGDTFTAGDRERVEVSGRFKNVNKVTGKLRVLGDFPDSTGATFTNCDSGRVKWRAGAND